MNKTVAARKRQQYANDNAVEAMRGAGFGKALTQSLSEDLIKKGTNDIKEQVFGTDITEHYRRQKITGDLVEGQELILNRTSQIDVAPQEDKKPKLDIAPGIDYRREVIEGDKKILKEDTRLIQTKIEEITIEIKKLSSAQKEIEVEFSEVIIEQRIVNPGKYHLNFFEWLLSTIRLARMKIEDSGAWLSTFQSKKNKRQYWAMFKKHGTTFGLSNERVVATQTG